MSHELNESRERRVEAVITEKESGEPTYVWTERIWAQWQPEGQVGEGAQITHGGYWLLCGDNTGAQNLIIYPYMLDALIELLQRINVPDEATT